jgi:tetratricopeptide (TPR) repeat protein/tRNA A-37 threonylcarbamoyl transferase component Bud32
VSDSFSGTGVSSMSLDEDRTIMVSSGDSDRSAPAPVAQWIQPGTTVGRYLVVEEVGSGAMGRVVRAYDPKLHREVALKLVETLKKADTAARLLREAQAMAQLSHPNVVAVFDVETVSESKGKPPSVVYIAMEFVRGRTLEEWVNGKERTWEEIVPQYVAAARGLSAAHAAGLVHRDFKPANVLVGTDGRIRVTDFGLVRGGHAPPSMEDSLDLDSVARRMAPGDDSLTRMSTVVGTPAYMPPEQHLGAAIGHPADQYAFCVSMFEALAGKRPFKGKTLKELFAKKMEHSIEWPRSTTVPRFVQRALERGMDPKPEARWPSMDALIEALTNDPAVARRRWLVFAGVGVVALGIGGWLYAERGRARAQCEAEAAAIFDDWNGEREADVQASFSAVGVGFADRAMSETSKRLDTYVADWSEARAQHCLAQQQSPQEHDAAALACFEERRAQLEALVGVLKEADAEAIRSSVGLVSRLPDPRLCGDPLAVERLPPPPEDPAVGERVQAVRELLLRARFVRATSRRAQALELSQQAYDEAKSIGYPPLLAEASLSLGGALVVSGELQQGIDMVEEAYWLAGENSYDEVAIDAAILLVKLEGENNERPEIARKWARHAQMTMARRGQDDPLRKAAMLQAMATAERVDGQYDRALELAEEARDIYVDVYGPEHPQVAYALNVIGNVHLRLANFGQARKTFEHSMSILEAVYGAEHPIVAQGFNNIGIVEANEGNFEGALVAFRKAEEALLRAWGPDHHSLVEQRANIAVAYAQLGDDEAALEHFERSLQQALKEGPNHPSVADAAGNLGVTLKRLGRYDEAIEQTERAVRILENAFGEHSARTARIRGNLAGMLADNGDLDKGLEMSLQALADAEATLPPSHPDIITGLERTAAILAAMKRWDEAIDYRQRELHRRRSRPEQTPKDLLGALIALGTAATEAGDEIIAEVAIQEARSAYDGLPEDARERGMHGYNLALLIARDDPEAAREYAKASKAFFEELVAEKKFGADKALAEIEAWLDERS